VCLSVDRRTILKITKAVLKTAFELWTEFINCPNRLKYRAFDNIAIQLVTVRWYSVLLSN
jgi:hypothetical protein